MHLPSRMRLVTYILASILASLVSGLAAAHDAAKTFDLKACEALLADTLVADDGVGDAVDEDLAVLAERRPLTDLLAKDPSKNLAAQFPFLLMNAGQRVGVLFRSQGVETVRIPGVPNNVIVYKIASDGGASTRGQRVVGQETSMEALVDTIDAQGMGDRASASVPLLVGSHGSGKSATIGVQKDAFEDATKGLKSAHGLWSFEWTGLDTIPSVALRQPRVVETKGVLPAVLDDNPLLLLPEDVREQVIAIGREAAVKMMNGAQDPTPFLELNPQDSEIRTALLLHYRNLAGRDLTSKEIVAVINKHVRLRRVVWDLSSGALPIIDAQNDDVDMGVLLTPNPVMRVTRNAADVFAWEPGKMLKGHGNVVFLDEVLRNPEELLRLFLRIFQDRKVSVGGSPDWPLDTVFIAASNSSTLNELLEDPDNHALVDRFLMLSMPWTTKPHEVAQVLLNNYSRSLKMQKLPGLQGDSVEPGPLAPVNFQELYPRGVLGRNTGPDYRYKLVLPMGDREIVFSPHAIRLMSYIISATRMNTNVAKAKEVMPTSKVPGSTIFRSAITRIRFEEGQMQDVTNGEIEDLRRLAELLNEGSEGIASRDGGRWLSRVVAEAKRAENRNTVTPDLVLKVYLQMLGSKIKTPDNKTRLRWHGLAMGVSTRLLVPLLEQDVNLAMAADQASIRAAYYEMFDEMAELYRNPGASTYKSRADNQEKPIDTVRKKFVEDYFITELNRPLDAANIAMFHEGMRANLAKDDDVLHPGLLSAITAYYASMTSRLVAVAELSKFAYSNEGDADVRSQFNTVVKNMMKLGYTQHSATAALRFIGRIKALGAQVSEDNE